MHIAALCTYAPPLCTAAMHRHARRAAMGVPLCTAMHRYAPPLCTAMHRYAPPLCTAMHDALLWGYRYAPLCAAAMHRYARRAAMGVPICTAMHRRYAPLCTTRCYGGTDMHRYARPLCALHHADPSCTRTPWSVRYAHTPLCTHERLCYALLCAYAPLCSVLCSALCGAFIVIQTRRTAGAGCANGAQRSGAVRR